MTTRLLNLTTDLYSTKEASFKEELLRILSIMAEEITNLKYEVNSLQNQIDNLTYNTRSYYE